MHFACDVRDADLGERVAEGERPEAQVPLASLANQHPSQSRFPLI